jgi:hypothetical protein
MTAELSYEAAAKLLGEIRVYAETMTQADLARVKSLLAHLAP